MSLAYNRISHEDDIKRGLIDIGQYRFKVESIEYKKTKNGKSMMLEVDMAVWDANNRQRKLTDWIVFAEGMEWKFRHFAKTCGLIEKYDNQTIEQQDFVGCFGFVKLGQKPSEDGSKLFNNVIDYIMGEGAAPIAASPSNAENFHDDDVPF